MKKEARLQEQHESSNDSDSEHDNQVNNEKLLAGRRWTREVAMKRFRALENCGFTMTASVYVNPKTGGPRLRCKHNFVGFLNNGVPATSNGEGKRKVQKFLYKHGGFNMLDNHNKSILKETNQLKFLRQFKSVEKPTVRFCWTIMGFPSDKSSQTGERTESLGTVGHGIPTQVFIGGRKQPGEVKQEDSDEEQKQHDEGEFKQEEDEQMNSLGTIPNSEIERIINQTDGGIMSEEDNQDM